MDILRTKLLFLVSIWMQDCHVVNTTCTHSNLASKTILKMLDDDKITLHILVQPVATYVGDWQGGVRALKGKERDGRGERAPFQFLSLSSTLSGRSDPATSSWPRRPWRSSWHLCSSSPWGLWSRRRAGGEEGGEAEAGAGRRRTSWGRPAASSGERGNVRLSILRGWSGQGPNP